MLDHHTHQFKGRGGLLGEPSLVEAITTENHDPGRQGWSSCAGLSQGSGALGRKSAHSQNTLAGLSTDPADGVLT